MDEATYLRLADRVERYWGVHLYARIVDDARAPRTDWYYVSVPRDVLAEDSDSVLTTLLHEWGHRTISPRTVRQMLIWWGVARSEGIGAAGDFLNLVTDVWVDAWYLRPECSWAAVYERGMRRHLEALADQLIGQFARGRGDALEVQRLAVLFDLESLALCSRRGTPHEPVLPITHDAWAILADDECSNSERLRKVARLLNYLYPMTGETEPDGSRVPVGMWGVRTGADAGSEPIEPILRGWLREGVLLDEADMVEMLGPVRGPMAHELAEVHRIYATLADVLPSATKRSASGPARPDGVAFWRWGQSPRELDWVGTLSTFGVSVPGVTTLKKRLRPGLIETGQAGQRTLCLVLDDSGSTWGRANARIVEASIALVETARAHQDEVGAVIFGDEVVASFAPTTDYTALERRFVRMAGMSGGTRLAPALAEALRLCTGQSAATCVITDAQAADAGTAEVRDLLARLAKNGPVMVLCVVHDGETVRRSAWAETPDVAAYRIAPDVRLAEQAIRLMSNARRDTDAFVEEMTTGNG